MLSCPACAWGLPSCALWLSYPMPCFSSRSWVGRVGSPVSAWPAPHALRVSAASLVGTGPAQLGAAVGRTVPAWCCPHLAVGFRLLYQALSSETTLENEGGNQKSCCPLAQTPTYSMGGLRGQRLWVTAVQRSGPNATESRSHSSRVTGPWAGPGVRREGERIQLRGGRLKNCWIVLTGTSIVSGTFSCSQQFWLHHTRFVSGFITAFSFLLRIDDEQSAVILTIQTGSCFQPALSRCGSSRRPCAPGDTHVLAALPAQGRLWGRGRHVPPRPPLEHRRG